MQITTTMPPDLVSRLDAWAASQDRTRSRAISMLVETALNQRQQARSDLDKPGDRDDVERVCEHLATRIEQQAGTRPNVGSQWRQAARMLLDADKRTEQQIHACIDWCQDDEFWRVNIMSMSKLRSKWVQLRAAATQPNRPGQPRRSTTDERIAAAQALKTSPAQPTLELPRGSK